MRIVGTASSTSSLDQQAHDANDGYTGHSHSDNETQVRIGAAGALLALVVARGIGATGIGGQGRVYEGRGASREIVDGVGAGWSVGEDEGGSTRGTGRGSRSGGCGGRGSGSLDLGRDNGLGLGCEVDGGLCGGHGEGVRRECECECGCEWDSRR